MVKPPVATGLGLKPLAVAIALIVVVALTLMGPLNNAEVLVGVVPSVV